MTAATPRCDELAREHMRIMAGPSAPGVSQDWIALAQKLERELSDGVSYAERVTTALRNLLKQVEKFTETEGEADFYTGEARAVLAKNPIRPGHDAHEGRAVEPVARGVESDAPTPALSFARQSIPEGWKLVPVESTQGMRIAPNTVVGPHAAMMIWRRMVEAAPDAPHAQCLAPKE